VLRLVVRVHPRQIYNKEEIMPVIKVKHFSSIKLKEITESDAKKLFNLVETDRKYLREWLPWVDGTKQTSDSLDFIKFATEQNKSGKGLTLGVWLDENNLIGTASFVSIENGAAEMGYWISSAHQGKGIITQSCRALMEYGFLTLKLNKIFMRCVDENVKSKKIIHKLSAACKTLQERQWVRGSFQNSSVIRGEIDRPQWLLARQKEIAQQSSWYRYLFSGIGRHAVGLSLLVANGLFWQFGPKFLSPKIHLPVQTGLLAVSVVSFFRMQQTPQEASASASRSNYSCI